MSRIFFSRKVSEINSSTETNSMMPEIAKVHYSNRVMKQIFAKQILNKEYMSKVQDGN